MAVVAVASAKGSPGVTTTCLALAWVWPVAFPGRQVLLVDADPAGSGIAFGYLRSELPGAGTLGLAGAHGLSIADLWNQLIGLDDDRWLLLGPTDPAQVAALEPVWQRLATRLAEPLTWDGATPVDVIVDVGRLDAAGLRVDRPHPLAAAADVVLLALRSSLASVATARSHLARAGSPADGTIRPLLIGDGHPYRKSEIVRALGRDVLGPLALDPRTASTFSDGAPAPAGFTRSALLRSARKLAESLPLPVEEPVGAHV